MKRHSTPQLQADIDPRLLSDRFRGDYTHAKHYQKEYRTGKRVFTLMAVLGAGLLGAGLSSESAAAADVAADGIGTLITAVSLAGRRSNRLGEEQFRDKAVSLAGSQVTLSVLNGSEVPGWAKHELSEIRLPLTPDDMIINRAESNRQAA